MKFTKKNAAERIYKATKEGLVETVKDPTTYILAGIKVTRDVIAQKTSKEIAKDVAISVATSATINVSTYVGVEVVNALNTRVEEINNEIN